MPSDVGMLDVVDGAAGGVVDVWDAVLESLLVDVVVVGAGWEFPLCRP